MAACLAERHISGCATEDLKIYCSAGSERVNAQCSLAQVLIGRHKLPEAGELLDSAREGAQKIDSGKGLDTAEVDLIFANWLIASHRFGPAKENLKLALTIDRAILPAGHPAIADILESLGAKASSGATGGSLGVAQRGCRHPQQDLRSRFAQPAQGAGASRSAWHAGLMSHPSIRMQKEGLENES